jgi:two-component system chemotaxis sensor kinase CheA
MLIEDEELRNLFKASSEEHLQKLEEGVLNLEKEPNDITNLEELLREAHSLKGDARMLGVRDVETLTHQIEHILGTIKRGEAHLTAELCDRICYGLDAIGKLVAEATGGQASGVQTFHVLAHLMGAKPTPPTLSIQEPTEEAIEYIEETIPPIEATINTEFSLNNSQLTNGLKRKSEFTENISSALNVEIKHSPSPVSVPDGKISSEYRIDTIRVETRNLDGLMTQAGELTVTKIRIAHRLAEIEEILAMWEEWNRDVFANRFLVDEVQTIGTPGRESSVRSSLQSSIAIGQLGDFLHRTEESRTKVEARLNELRSAVYEDSQRLEAIAGELSDGIRLLRLLPLSTIFQMFPRMVRDLAKSQAKQVELAIAGGETAADKRILEEMKDPLMHILRNCVDHGIETPAERQQQGKPPQATISIKAAQNGNSILIEVADDGRGLDLEKIKQTAIKRGICREEQLSTMTLAQIHSLIFVPGFSTQGFVTEVSGRGVGLDVVRTNVERLKGNILVESIPGQGCTFRIFLSTTLATTHVLIVEVAGNSYALPVEYVQTTRLVPKQDIFAIEGRETINLDGQPVSVARLADLLELSPQDSIIQKLAEDYAQPCIILMLGEQRLGIFVDALLDEQNVVIKPQSKLLKRVRNVAGATILGTGEVCTILNPPDLIKSVQKQAASFSAIAVRQSDATSVQLVNSKPVILLAEDSIAIRTQEKRILEGAGYEVVTAVDGLDGYNKLRTRSFDAVISDVQMPNLDGLGFAARIRQHKEYNELPIILVTSLASDEDKRRGAEAGANAYITKGTFSQEVLLETLRRLI